MKKPIFSNKKIVVKNLYWEVVQRDFIDSVWRKWDIITMNSVKSWDGCIVLALTSDKKIILNKEYKFWPDEFQFVSPAGFVEKDYDIIDNVKNELNEETWYTTKSEIISLGAYNQNNYISWKKYLFYTTNCYKKWE